MILKRLLTKNGWWLFSAALHLLLFLVFAQNDSDLAAVDTSQSATSRIAINIVHRPIEEHLRQSTPPIAKDHPAPNGNSPSKRSNSGSRESLKSDATSTGTYTGTGIGAYMPDMQMPFTYGESESEATVAARKFDPLTNISAEEKSRVMPSLLKLARELSMSITLSDHLRRLVGHGYAEVEVRPGDQNLWKMSEVKGDPYLRAFLVERLKELQQDPIINDAILAGAVDQFRIRLRVRRFDDVQNGQESNAQDYQVDGYQITLNFEGLPSQFEVRKYWPEERYEAAGVEMSLNPAGAMISTEVGPVKFTTGITSSGAPVVLLSPSDREQRRKAGFAKKQEEKRLKSSPAFVQPAKAR